MTLIGACRDVLRVIRAEPEAQPEEFRPAAGEVEILLINLGEVWHDVWCVPAPLVFETEQTVVHSGGFVTDEGAHINRVECLWSL